jgi:hypothetical protein
MANLPKAARHVESDRSRFGNPRVSHTSRDFVLDPPGEKPLELQNAEQSTKIRANGVQSVRPLSLTQTKSPPGGDSGRANFSRRNTKTEKTSGSDQTTEGMFDERT